MNQQDDIIHFNDYSISWGKRESLCGLDEEFINKTTDHYLYLKSVKSVNCKFCKSQIIKLGLIKPNFNRINML
ncbi:MAG TPA: hypothetical protein VKR58_00355 [Aquella sp.]|nr:hypothetical protein [Aquella sp.]